MNPTSPKKYLIPLIIAVVIVAGGVYLSRMSKTSTDMSLNTATTTDIVATTSPVTSTTTATTTVTVPKPAATSPVITVVSPKGNESWAIGSKKTITWKITGPITPKYKVALVLNPGLSPLAIVSATTTSYVLTVPEMVCLGGDACGPISMTEKYQLDVELYNDDVCIGFCVVDETPAKLASKTSIPAITITASETPKITVVSPIGGKAWQGGTTQTVQVLITGANVGPSVDLFLDPDMDPENGNGYSLGSFPTASFAGTKVYSVSVPYERGDRVIYAVLSAKSINGACTPSAVGCASQPVVQAADYSDGFISLVN